MARLNSCADPFPIVSRAGTSLKPLSRALGGRYDRLSTCGNTGGGQHLTAALKLTSLQDSAKQLDVTRSAVQLRRCWCGSQPTRRRYADRVLQPSYRRVSSSGQILIGYGIQTSSTGGDRYCTLEATCSGARRCSGDFRALDSGPRCDAVSRVDAAPERRGIGEPYSPLPSGLGIRRVLHMAHRDSGCSEPCRLNRRSCPASRHQPWIPPRAGCLGSRLHGRSGRRCRRLVPVAADGRARLGNL